MKNLKWIVGVVLIALSLNVSAQKKERDPEQVAKHRTEKMTEKFNLTEEQKVEVHKINQASAKEMALINKEKLTKEERKEKMQALRQENFKQIEAVLTEEQKAKAKEMREEHKGRKGGHMKGHH